MSFGGVSIASTLRAPAFFETAAFFETGFAPAPVAFLASGAPETGRSNLFAGDFPAPVAFVVATFFVAFVVATFVVAAFVAAFLAGAFAADFVVAVFVVVFFEVTFLAGAASAVGFLPAAVFPAAFFPPAGEGEPARSSRAGRSECGSEPAERELGMWRSSRARDAAEEETGREAAGARLRSQVATRCEARCPRAPCVDADAPRIPPSCSVPR